MAIRVLIVDDSFVVRSLLEEGLLRHPDIEVDMAADPIYAMEKMEARWPDVLLLDVEMPRMDGLTFLRRIMATRPTPVVICSNLAQAGAATSVQALQAGAFAIVPKPKSDLRDFLQHAADDLAGILRAAAAARVDRLVSPPPPRPESQVRSGLLPATDVRVVAMAGSTGGAQALQMVLQSLPGGSPAVLVVLPLPTPLLTAFAETLNRDIAMRAKVASSGDPIERGWVYLAPADQHLTVQRDGATLRCQVKKGPRVSKRCPSADVLFRSLAKEVGPAAMGFVLTGMGEDGAHGLKEMREAGAATFAQDEASCVVFEAPREALRLGAVDRAVELGSIPGIVAGLG